MIKQKIIEANVAAKSVRDELKMFNERLVDLNNQKLKIPIERSRLKSELKNIGRKSKLFEDVAKTSKAINKKIDDLEPELELIKQQILFVNSKTSELSGKLTIALKTLSKAREGYIDSLESKLIEDDDLMLRLNKLKSAYYSFAAVNGSVLADPMSWLEFLDDNITDSDKHNNESFEIYNF